MNLGDRIKRYEASYHRVATVRTPLMIRSESGLTVRFDVLPTYDAINEAIGGLFLLSERGPRNDR